MALFDKTAQVAQFKNTAEQPQVKPSPTAPVGGDGIVPVDLMSDAKLLQFWTVWKKESTDQRWIYERQWMRNIWYMLNRQWIYFDSKRGQWQDKRLAKWVPRPITNICKEAVQSVRSMLAAINYGANARPLGDSKDAMITASVADDYAPVLHDDHDMNHIMSEFDWWALVCGNAMLHTAVIYDRKNGVAQNPLEQCSECGGMSTSADIANAGGVCPKCKQPGQFQPAMNPDGTPQTQEVVLPRGTTFVLSPFEYMYPLMYEKFEASPYVIRMRWRDKSWYTTHPDPEVRALASKLSFGVVPQERSMQIFKTLPFQSDLGIAPPYFASGGANVDSEGIVEYDVWMRPNGDYPKGLVVRFIGENNPQVFHSQQENLPGPLPYTDVNGNPFFPFYHARFDTIGGRAVGSGILDPIIQKQDQINQVDSLMLMMVMRMSNPIWLEPKGAEVEKFTGEPGLVVKWNPLIGNGMAKPERIPGAEIPQGLFQYRQLLKQEAEELAGTYDLLKGTKPAGVEAYAAMNLLLERSQARFTFYFKERGDAYKGWMKAALELERQFGPETRAKWIMAPTKNWAMETYKKADLTGSVEIIIEDGTLSPKTSLGERASIDHLFQLGMIDTQDPDQKMAVFQKFGQERLLPGIDAQVKEAWRIFDEFAKFALDRNAIMMAAQQHEQTLQQAQAQGQPAPPLTSPLTLKPWHNPVIFRSEAIKWCVSDDGREVFSQNPGAEVFMIDFLQTINMQLMPPPQAPAPGMGGSPMANSNRNAGGAGPSSSGAAGTSQNNIEANAQRSIGGQSSPTHG